MTQEEIDDIKFPPSQEQIEQAIYEAVSAAPNLFVVARALRTALQDDWERAEVAALLTEEH